MSDDASLFEAAVAVRPRGSGRYCAGVRAEFNGPAAPNGGVLAATMLRAAQSELGPGAPPPRTVAAHFLDAPQAGPVELVVEVLRRGRRVCAAETRMAQGERLVATATFVFSAARPQAATLRRDPPERLTTPDAVPELEFGASPGAPALFRALRIRPTYGGLPFSGGTEATAGGWMELRNDDAALDPARLVALCDLWWPAVYSILTAPHPAPTIALTVYLRQVERPVPAPVFARFATEVIAEAHLEESGELWSTEGELLAESRQLALLPAPREGET